MRRALLTLFSPYSPPTRRTTGPAAAHQSRIAQAFRPHSLSEAFADEPTRPSAPEVEQQDTTAAAVPATVLQVEEVRTEEPAAPVAQVEEELPLATVAPLLFSAIRPLESLGEVPPSDLKEYTNAALHFLNPRHLAQRLQSILDDLKKTETDVSADGVREALVSGISLLRDRDLLEFPELRAYKAILGDLVPVESVWDPITDLGSGSMSELEATRTQLMRIFLRPKLSNVISSSPTKVWEYRMFREPLFFNHRMNVLRNLMTEGQKDETILEAIRDAYHAGLSLARLL